MTGFAIFKLGLKALSRKYRRTPVVGATRLIGCKKHKGQGCPWQHQFQVDGHIRPPRPELQTGVSFVLRMLRTLPGGPPHMKVDARLDDLNALLGVDEA